tara:strand:- start:107 stop:3223 length:3117 start_codon:yes stop_codon:yes gene_type:complete
MPASGHINETVQFRVSGADSVTGVKFGQGRANFSVIAETALEAIVPNTATWDHVVFQKQNITEVFNIVATGDGEAEAYSALTGQIDSLGYYAVSSGCTTGQATFSNYNQPSGICIITATGSSAAIASGVMDNAYGSGFCGGPTGFSAGGYNLSETSLSGISVTNYGGETSKHVSLGLVQYTGNLNIKNAKVTVTCLTDNIQSQTDYKFVPIPEVNSTTYAPSGGGDITIVGSCFSGVTGVSIGSSQDISFSIANNSTISGQAPSGTFEDFIHLKVQSGISVASPVKYITSGETIPFKFIPDLFIFTGTRPTVLKGSVSSAIINGSGFSGLTDVHFLSKHLQKVEVTGASGFSYTSGQIFAPISGLETGLHDLIVSRADQSVTGANYLTVIGSGETSYSYRTLLTSGFEYVGEHVSSNELYSFLIARNWDFGHAGKADRISLNFSDARITGGSTIFELDKKANHNNTVSNDYTIQGYSAASSGASETNAYNKWGSGIYTLDKWGYPYEEGISYKVNNRVCNINTETTSYYSSSPSFNSTGLHSGVVTGDPNNLAIVNQLKLNDDAQFLDYVTTTNLNCSIVDRELSSGVVGVVSSGSGIYINTTGFSTDDNMTWINNEISEVGNYPNYTLISTTTGAADNFESYSYTSGIEFPFPSSKLNDLGDAIWSNLLSSGLNDLYPGGTWTGQHSLTSGFSVTTGHYTAGGELNFSGLNVIDANNKVIAEMADNYSQCSTGDASYFNSGKIIDLSKSGLFYGYCTGSFTDGIWEHGGDTNVSGCHPTMTITGQMSGILTGLIHSTNEHLSGNFGNFEILNHNITTGVEVGLFNLCNQVATGDTSGDALDNLTGWLQPEFFYSGRCIAGDLEGEVVDRYYLSGLGISFSAPEVTLDDDNFTATSSGFVNARHWVAYEPEISGSNSGINVSTSCPSPTDIKLNIQRNRIIYDTSGLIASPAYSVHRFVTTLNANCTGYRTTLQVNCLKYYNGWEKLGRITFYEDVKDAWSGYLDEGSYRLKYVSGSFTTSLGGHTLGSGTINVDQYV